MALSPEQQAMLNEWFPAAVRVRDMSWGLIDTTVLHLRWDANDIVVKAGGPNNSDIAREITGRREFTAPWLADHRVGRMLHADCTLNLVAIEYLPGVLIDDTPAAHEPEIHWQAGQLLAALHGQAARTDAAFEAVSDARALAWLDGDHRIDADTEGRLRAVIAEHKREPQVVVPTHGDWQPRNWLLDGDRLLVIDLGRAAWRPALTDFARLARQQWEGHPELEAAFLRGYGDDPRDPDVWRRTLIREAIGTACWAYQVGNAPFEQQGHRMVRQALALWRT